MIKMELELEFVTKCLKPTKELLTSKVNTIIPNLSEIFRLFEFREIYVKQQRFRRQIWYISSEWNREMSSFDGF